MGRTKGGKHASKVSEQVPPDEEVRISAANLLLGLDPFVLKHKHKNKSTKTPVQDDDKPTSATTPTADLSTESSGGSSTTEEASSDDQSSPSKASTDAETPAEAQSVEADDSSSAPETSDAESSAGEAAQAIVDEKSEKSVSFAEDKSQTDESTQTSSIDAMTTDSENDLAKPMPSTAPTDKWTASDDAMIIGMKEDGATWAVIGNAISRGKNEVKKRYHEIKVVTANAASTPTNKQASVDTTEPEKPQKAKPSKDTEHDEFKDKAEKTCDDEKSNTKAHTKRRTQSSSKSPPSTTPTSLSAMEAALLASPPSSTTSSSSDGDEAGYDADGFDPYSPDPRPDPFAHERERRRQDRFMQRHLWAALYPRHRTAQDHQDKYAGATGFADRGFSRRDRRLLASLEDRRLGNRWLEMQANFFNATGRMLPLHLIKAKLEGQGAADEEQRLPRVARFEQMVASWNSSVADSEELLDPALAGEVPEDAMM
ncbi:hypothetical protein HYQ45_012521 [Verticillium longisporum]|uniref:Myb-like domain-containing protein n=1 Tax=Verticillium longisporum TaxID=100787 RepID=A0A8I3ALV2_VERLO|nr:hypothetical protein HYQ45_012521 [Verticillium longisporum]